MGNVNNGTEVFQSIICCDTFNNFLSKSQRQLKSEGFSSSKCAEHTCNSITWFLKKYYGKLQRKAIAIKHFVALEAKVPG